MTKEGKTTSGEKNWETALPMKHCRHCNIPIVFSSSKPRRSDWLQEECPFSSLTPAPSLPLLGHISLQRGLSWLQGRGCRRCDTGCWHCQALLVSPAVVLFSLWSPQSMVVSTSHQGPSKRGRQPQPTWGDEGLVSAQAGRICWGASFILPGW